jgi:Uri superfamily endonuclease
MPPERGGTYVLLLNLSRSKTIQVGRLGRFRFPAGWYAYVGSAHGPGGLAARLRRHLRASKPLHWHVDYLRAYARPIETWYTAGNCACECTWAQGLAALPGAHIPAPRFGASDCRCAAHLVHFAAPPDLTAFAHAVDEPVSQERLDG